MLEKEALRTLDGHSKYHIRGIPIGTEFYPKQLEKIKDPPKVLFARGNLDLLKKAPGVSIVGSRNATPYGLKATEKIATHFVKKGHTIVSGLATGIDYEAHRSCLLNHGETIAVLAHGLHKIYPLGSASLAQSILDKNGLLISEHPFGVEPKKHFFVLRNRIQVGLSSFSIIVESKKKSGTMSHANYCLKADHPLYVVLPQDPSPNYEGNIWLHEERGAIPLRSRADYPQ